MTYNTSIPGPNDLLSDSQLDIQQNFLAANTRFGVNHYTFTDNTVNQGKHNLVTTPIITPPGHPTTIADEPKFYANKDTTNIGTLQYSRGPSNPVPTPLTSLQSPNTPIVLVNNAVTTILNFVGCSRALATLTIANFGSVHAFTEVFIRYDATDKFFLLQVGDKGFFDGTVTTRPILQAITSTDTLRVINNSGATLNNVYWTLNFQRIEV